MPPGEVPRVAAHGIIVDDLVFAVADVRLDECLPLVLIRWPAARRVGSVFVDRALGPRANVAESVLDVAEGPKPVDRGSRESVGGKRDPLMIPERRQPLDECVVPVPVGRDDAIFECVPWDLRATDEGSVLGFGAGVT